MEKFNLTVKASVSRDLRHILRRMESLRDDPRPPGCEKLSGQERYRIRVGWYRILYEVSDTDVTVVVVKVGHRKDVCR